MGVFSSRWRINSTDCAWTLTSIVLICHLQGKASFLFRVHKALGGWAQARGLPEPVIYVRMCSQHFQWPMDNVVPGGEGICPETLEFPIGGACREWGPASVPGRRAFTSLFVTQSPRTCQRVVRSEQPRWQRVAEGPLAEVSVNEKVWDCLRSSWTTHAPNHTDWHFCSRIRLLLSVLSNLQKYKFMSICLKPFNGFDTPGF